MNCYVCGQPARQLGTDHDGEHIACPECGEYTISNAVRRELGERMIDAGRLREDLHRQRQSNATLVAHINSETVVWRDAPKA